MCSESSSLSMSKFVTLRSLTMRNFPKIASSISTICRWRQIPRLKKLPKLRSKKTRSFCSRLETG